MEPSTMAKTGFNNLPLETVLQIVTYLTNDMDRLCLSLTCHGLLNLLDNDKSLQRLPALRAFRNKSLSQMGKRCSERWKLLRQLENSFWRCCFGCFKLHPVLEFSDRDLRTDSDKRTCIFGPLVGTVCLCPCMEITFRDKAKLVKFLSEELKSQDPRTKEGYFKYYKNKRLFFTKEYASHHCSYLPKPTETDPFRAGLRCIVELFLEKDGNLIAETRYKITSNERPSHYLQNHDLAICPHRRLITQIYEIQRAHDAPGRTRGLATQVKVDGTWWKWSEHSVSCSGCKTTICSPKWTFQRSKTAAIAAAQPDNIFVFKTRRCLGNAVEKADEVWYQQTEGNIS